MLIDIPISLTDKYSYLLKNLKTGKLFTMARPITIDNYDVAVHQRWATDQEVFEPIYLDDTGDIPSHLQVAALDKSLISKWEELFQADLQRHSFANFSPPPNYLFMRNRFFSFVISPQFDWAEDAEEEDQEEQKEEEARQADIYKKMIKSKKAESMPLSLFEKERSALLNLIDSVQTLNGFLRDINGRKLQYQKG